MEAGALQCPTCGAAVAPNATACPYCRAFLQTVACRRCMGMMFSGCKFCPHCGASTKSVALGRETGRECPRCSGSLHALAIVNLAGEACEDCGGLWLEVVVFDRICSDADYQNAATGIELPEAPVNTREVKYLKCPECRELMNRSAFSKNSGVITDVCRRHGVWLDHDELRRIVEFIQAGGLARARKMEAEDLERRRAALEAQQQMLDSAYANRFARRGPDLGVFFDLL